MNTKSEPKADSQHTPIARYSALWDDARMGLSPDGYYVQYSDHKKHVAALLSALEIAKEMLEKAYSCKLDQVEDAPFVQITAALKLARS